MLVFMVIGAVIYTSVLKVVGGVLLVAVGAILLVRLSQLPERRLRQIGSVFSPFMPRSWQIRSGRLWVGILLLIILLPGVLLLAAGIAEMLGYKL